ncbi:MAG: phenylacetate-CoA oxygenase/reductase subunit PaaK [Acidimicrobiia bacterium]|nr:phenylacetate-CoA oxygenase/reductase subunit PaaK [Acidimicrobiia bacterium]
MTTAAPVFHELEVESVEPLTDDAVALTFHVPDDLAGEYRYLPGQHVTLKAIIDGEDIRRSYSICANANEGRLRVGIKRLQGGAFSTYATTALKAGDRLEVMPPMGEFTITPDATQARHYGAVAAGSGITPVLSLVSTILESEPASTFTLIFGNRNAGAVMFLEELEGLKDRYPDRFQLVHVLTGEIAMVPLFSGRLDQAKLAELFDRVVDADHIDAWYLCGPYEVVTAAQTELAARGVPDNVVHDELFFAGPVDPSSIPAPPADDEAGTVALTFTLDGRGSQVRMRPETTVLDAALAIRPELPFSCKGGMCASCKARVLEGSVEMDKNFALVEDDLAAGYVLTCQAHPTSDAVTVDFDQR